MRYVKEHWGYLTDAGLFPGIDLLRSLAVAMVVLFHFKLLPFGWIGVDIFFVISGFLIGGIILDKSASGKFSFLDFYKRRALRILPVYYFVILICFFFKSTGPADWVALKSVISGMLFMHMPGPYFFPDFFVIDNSYIVGGSWSLVVEEIFYLLAPLVILLFMALARKNLKIISALLALVVLSGIWARIKMTSGFAPDDFNWYYASFVQFHSRYDELTAGVLAAALVRVIRNPRAQAMWWLIGASFFVALFMAYILGKPNIFAKPYMNTADTIWLPTLLGLIGLTLVMGLHWLNIKSLPVIILARLSYPLYLVHIVLYETTDRYAAAGILKWMIDTFSQNGKSVIFIALAVVLSYLVSLLVEYPFIRLYKKPSLVNIPKKNSAEMAVA
ncbi:acyltransferase family protein [Pseudomonas atacamensis]|jgi:peptidoglycan/LPS O-acetylase OafA/YrhL|uniref:acyltransferase family protein n=1 Tax=Pseudomonas atacamensis TaxID=2565368 RepID=UPI003CF83DD6